MEQTDISGRPSDRSFSATMSADMEAEGWDRAGGVMDDTQPGALSLLSLVLQPF